MSIERCKANLLKLLSDPSNRVVALSGKWGTGKSHLWRELRTISPDDSVKKGVYVSLFGVNSITELKLRIVQECVPNMDSSAVKKFAEYAGPIKKALNVVSSRFSALDDIALLAAPTLLRDRFIAIDDIERKQAQLNIDEVLGFIDDLTQNKNSRVLLILNTDKLSDKALWDQLREKIIDHELRLDTSPGEAFDIARTLVTTDFAEAIRPCIEICNISNIRVVSKIIRVVNRVLADFKNVDSEVADRIIPSSVLLSGIYYKGLEDGPNIDFVLSLDADAAALRATAKGSKDKPTEEDKARARWKVLLHRLKINSVDEFEKLVVEFLESGLLDESALNVVVTRYCSEVAALAAQRRVQSFFFRCTWHPELSDAQLVEEARALVADAVLLDAFFVTALYDRLSAMPGGSTIAKEILDSWLANFHHNLSGKDLGRVDDYNLFHRPLHPQIRAEIDAAYARQRARKTLLDVYRDIIVRSGWGSDEEAMMKAATPAEISTLLTSLTGEDLKLFLLKNIDLYINRANYQKHFGSAMDNFVAACRTICVQNANPRLTALIKGVFSDSKLSDALEPPEPEIASPAAETQQ